MQNLVVTFSTKPVQTVIKNGMAVLFTVEESLSSKKGPFASTCRRIVKNHANSNEKVFLKKLK